MSIKVPTKYLIFALCGAFLIVFLLGGYLGLRMGKNSSKPLENALNEQITTYKAKIRQDSVIIVLSEQEVISQKKAKEALALTNKDLKALNMRLTTDISNLQFRIDTLLQVKHDGRIVVIRDTVTKVPSNAILLPFNFSRTDKYLTLDGTFHAQGDMSLGIVMKADVDVIMGYDKKTKKPTIAVFTDNPYIKTVGIKSFKTDVQKPKKFGIGIQAGYGYSIGSNKANPYVGAGLSYNIIRF
jgi:hypothetical protein